MSSYGWFKLRWSCRRCEDLGSSGCGGLAIVGVVGFIVVAWLGLGFRAKLKGFRGYCLLGLRDPGQPGYSALT